MENAVLYDLQNTFFSLNFGVINVRIMQASFLLLLNIDTHASFIITISTFQIQFLYHTCVTLE